MDSTGEQLQMIATDVIGGERGETLLKANDLLVTIGREDHYNVIEALLSVADQFDTLALIGQIEQAVSDEIHGLIRDMGIGLMSCPLPLLIELWGMIQSVESVDDPEPLLVILEDSSDTVETFVELIEEMIERDKYDYLPHLEYVSFTSLQTLKRILEDRAAIKDHENDSDRSLHDLDALQTRLHQVRRKVPSDAFDTLLNDGYQVGYSLATYLNAFIDNDTRELTKHITDEYASFFIHAAVASGLETIQILPNASSCMESRLGDDVMYQTFYQQLQAKVSTL